MALDVLLQAIADDGEAEARQLIDAARSRAVGIQAAADARAERRCADALASREVALRSDRDTRRAGALREAREQVLRTRSRFLETVFSAVTEALPGALDTMTGGALQRLCREARACFPDAAVQIRCRPGLAATLLTDPDSSGSAEVVADDSIPEGVVVESVDGAARVDNTLVARMERLRPTLSIALLQAVAKGRGA